MYEIELCLSSICDRHQVLEAIKKQWVFVLHTMRLKQTIKVLLTPQTVIQCEH